MARVKRIETSRKEHVCGRGHVIPKGSPYLSAAPGFRGNTLIRCVEHPFRPSELTTSLRSEPLAAIEAFEDAASAGFDDLDALTSAWEELTSALEEYVSTRQEALDAWEYGNSSLEELVEQAQMAFDEADAWRPEEYGGDVEEPDEGDPSTWNEHGSYEEALEAYQENVAEWVTEQAEEALSVAGGLDV